MFSFKLMTYTRTKCHFNMSLKKQDQLLTHRKNVDLLKVHNHVCENQENKTWLQGDLVMGACVSSVV